MNRRFLFFVAIIFAGVKPVAAQENNPLINSGLLIDSAIKLNDNAKYKEAIELFKKINYGDTNYYRALYEIAYSLTLDSQLTSARIVCETGLSEPNDHWPSFYTLYGNLVDDLGDTERAIRIYDSAIVLYPAYPDLYLNKGNSLMRLEKYAEAEEVLKRSIIINPYATSSHFKLGLCALQQGNIIPAFLSFCNYLLLQPSGRYQRQCINLLNKICNATTDVRELLDKRTSEQSDNFSTLEKIILSKIALDKKYPLLLKLDDPISRQIQVLFEKLEYDPADQNFWMQYYVPFFKAIFDEKKFEPFVYRLFVTLKVEAIQDYVKKKEKNIQEVIDMASYYYNQLRGTAELNYDTRKDMNFVYHHEDGHLYGKGSTKDNGEKLVGDWEFYYRPGNINSKGRFDENGLRTGTWRYFHFNGKLKAQQQFIKGKLEGEERFYYENGTLSSIALYRDGKATGESKSFFIIGTLLSVVNYKDGAKHGEQRVYSSNGILLSTYNYREDSLHGPFYTYYKNGLPESQGNYNNGQLEGLYKGFHDNGRLSMEGNYMNGDLSGTWKIFHENGKLRIHESFVKGELEGDYAEYYDNGQLLMKSIYKKGKLLADVEYFDKDGKLYFINSYDDNIVKSVRYFNKAGKEIGRSERRARKLYLTTYYSDGFKRSEAEYNDMGNINGKEIFYFKSGRISSENSYINGELEGPGIDYFPNGKPMASIQFVSGEKNGYQKQWFIHGQLQQEGWIIEGDLQGSWINYDEVGNIISRTDYLNNDPNGYKTEYYPDGRKNSITKFQSGWIQEFVQFDTTGKVISRNIFDKGNGKFRINFFNGAPYAEGEYVNSDLDGPFKYFYFDGKPNVLMYYKKGMLDSVYRSYLHDGKLSIEGQYKLGMKTGTWKTYYTSGKLSFVENYEDGKINGKRTYYFENGKIDTESEMKDDRRNGWTKKYDETGAFAYQIRYEDDLPISYSYHDKTGKLVPEIAIPGSSGKIKTYYANGHPSSDFEYMDGKVVGENIDYYSNGKLRGKSREDYSVSEGSTKYYFANGQLQYDYNFLHNNLHGPYKEFNEKGILIEEGNYYNSQQHGQFNIFSASGHLLETRYYFYGKLLDIKK